jgi:hypothetical protein
VFALLGLRFHFHGIVRVGFRLDELGFPRIGHASNRIGLVRIRNRFDRFRLDVRNLGRTGGIGFAPKRRGMHRGRTLFVAHDAFNNDSP